MVKALSVVAAALLLAACGNTAAPTPSPSQAAASVAKQDDVTACQHYKAQRAVVKALTYPTLADVTKFVTGLALDNADAAPDTALYRDLTIMDTEESANLAAIGGTSKSVSVEAISEKVLSDCEALGVQF